MPNALLVLTGTNIISGATVLWHGAARTTTFISSTFVTAAIPSSDLTTGGITVPVTLKNPGLGELSSPQTFTIFRVTYLPLILK